MKDIIGLLLIIGGIVLGLYMGVYVCFFGGIVQIIEAVNVTPIVTVDLAWGIVRLCCSGIAGSLAASVLILPGMDILQS